MRVPVIVLLTLIPRCVSYGHADPYTSQDCQPNHHPHANCDEQPDCNEQPDHDRHAHKYGRQQQRRDPIVARAFPAAVQRSKEDRMLHTTRYQGAIVRDDHILLIKHTEHADGRSYWVIPGGRIEPGESEEACVQREMQEETCLQVQVQRLLLETPSVPGDAYQRRKTFLCQIVSGEAAPGYEPEAGAAAKYAITEVCWIDLRNPATWNELIVSDPITYPLLQQLHVALGYGAAASTDSR